MNESRRNDMGELTEAPVEDSLPIEKDQRFSNKEANSMDFSKALSAIKSGEKMQRSGWNGKGMFIFLVPGSIFAANRPPLLGIYPEGKEITYLAHIDMVTVSGAVVPWLASQTDVLAEDWERV